MLYPLQGCPHVTARQHLLHQAVTAFLVGRVPGLCRRKAKPSRHPLRLHRSVWRVGPFRGCLLSLPFVRTRQVHPHLMFGPFPVPRRVPGTMASADSCRFSRAFRPSLSSYSTPGRPPRIRTFSFLPHPPRLPSRPLAARASSCDADSPGRAGLTRFVFLRSGLCLRLPLDSASRRTPLPSASG